VPEWEVRRRRFVAQQEVRIICGVAACPIAFDGAFAEASAARDAHRARAHPGWAPPPPPRRRRRRSRDADGEGVWTKEA
jgi:hypothetical protein